MHTLVSALQANPASPFILIALFSLAGFVMTQSLQRAMRSNVGRRWTNAELPLILSISLMAFDGWLLSAMLP